MSGVHELIIRDVIALRNRICTYYKDPNNKEDTIDNLYKLLFPGNQPLTLEATHRCIDWMIEKRLINMKGDGILRRCDM
jgi:hypothetical protein